MKLGLIAKRLYMGKDKIITDESIKKLCKELKLDYNYAAGYLIREKYISRIFKGIFYIKSIEERKLNKIDADQKDIIARALSIKGVKNWYFGLSSALKINAMTHEYFSVDYIISDKIFRPRPFNVLGKKVKFVKIGKKLFSFGIIRKGDINFSDKEKTILDTAYLAKYNGKSDFEVRKIIEEYIKGLSKSRLKDYSKYYPKSIIRAVGEVI